MTTEFVELKPDMTPIDVFHTIRASGLKKKTIYNCYVTDASRYLIGVLSVKDLINHLNEDVTVAEIMEVDVISSHVVEEQTKTIHTMKKYGFLALPVTDGENRLVGVITLDNVMAVIEDETTEDIEIMAAITPSEKTYFKTSVFETWKMRVPWLMFLMISSIFTSKILQFFEGKLTTNAALIAFIPVIMDTAGNAGSQSSATITRSLSTREVNACISDVLLLLWKEVRAAFLCGVSLAVVNFLKMTAMDNVSWKISLTVSISICIIVMMADLIGAVLPIGAKKTGFDPAVTASPLITTICDTLSLLVYFGTAIILLRI